MTTAQETHPLAKLLKGKPEQWAETINASIEEIARGVDARKVEIEQLREQLKQLKALRGAVVPEAKPKKEKAAKGTKAAGAGVGAGADKRLKMHDIISRKGPQRPKDLGPLLGCTAANAWQLLQHEWFTKNDDGTYGVAVTE